MLNYLDLHGFKCFRDQKLGFAPLTLLCGLNSSGKSSVIQALLLLHKKRPLPGHGPLADFISIHARDFFIETGDEQRSFSLSYAQEKGIETLGYPDLLPELYSFIGAARLGPEVSLPLSLDSDLMDVGEKGQYVLDFLARHAELAELPRVIRHERAKGSSVRLNVSAWLNMISPGVNFEPYLDRKSDSGRAEYSARRPAHVGFGLSYTLPIIANVLIYAALLSSGKYPHAIILIENPEAHLHPSGQTRIGEFLARAASCGVQCIVETHSDHLLNGVRIAVKNGLLPARGLACHFLSYDFDKEVSQVENPLLDDHGMFDEWPDGFFDEAEKNLERLL